MIRKKAPVRKNKTGGNHGELIEFALTQVGECVLIGDRNGHIRFVNEPFLCRSGLERSDLELLLKGKPPGKPVNSCINTLIRQIIAGGAYHETVPFETHDGYTAFIEINIADYKTEDKQSSFIATLKDVSTRKKAEDRLREIAYSDYLTGLPNRTLFLELVDSAISGTKDNAIEDTVAVILMNLDRFKSINDGIGHEAADQLLISLAGRLSEVLPEGYILSRIMGVQFAILSPPGSGLKEAHKICEILQNTLKEPIATDGKSIYLTASFGIAISSPEIRKPKEMLINAETAMYSAKRNGGGQRAVFEQSMLQRARIAFQLESDLHRAMGNNEFITYFQPIVSLQTGKTAAFEALIRWKHPQKGIVMPSEFLRTAEQTRLIIPIGLQVFEMTCAHLKQWKTTNPKSTGVTVSVNISGVQFHHPELVSQLDLILRNQGLRPQDIKLEITESVLLGHADHAVDMLNQLKAMGFNLCIDDFGTGYASMSYLNDYPIETVKIDRSFVVRMATDTASLQLVKSMVNMAHDLGKEVIVEGVETTEQLSKTRALRCEYVQGFLFSEAVDSDESAELIAKRWYC